MGTETSREEPSSSVVYHEEEPSLFSHEGALYSVNAVLNIAARKVVQLVLITEIDVVPLENLDSKRVFKSDFRYPVILLSGEKPFVIVDGAHRAAHAKLLNREEVPARFITEEELETTRI